MATRFAHVGLVAQDPQALAGFHVEAFGCVRGDRPLQMSGAWLDRSTGLRGARASGLKVHLPGYGASGPTIEIVRYGSTPSSGQAATVDRSGLGHLAFEVSDFDAALARVITAGGSAIGEPAMTIIDGQGCLRVVFVRDPEDNIVELQTWTP